MSTVEPATPSRAFAWHHVVRATLRDTDGMGHVNNAVYLSWMEEARTGYVIDRRGFRGLEDVDFVLASATVDYRSPVFLGETVDVWCVPSRVGDSSWDLDYEARVRGDGRLVLEGRTVQVQYDYRNRRPAALPEEWRRLLQEDLT